MGGKAHSPIFICEIVLGGWLNSVALLSQAPVGGLVGSAVIREITQLHLNKKEERNSWWF